MTSKNGVPIATAVALFFVIQFSTICHHARSGCTGVSPCSPLIHYLNGQILKQTWENCHNIYLSKLAYLSVPWWPRYWGCNIHFPCCPNSHATLWLQSCFWVNIHLSSSKQWISTIQLPTLIAHIKWPHFHSNNISTIRHNLYQSNPSLSCNPLQTSQQIPSTTIYHSLINQIMCLRLIHTWSLSILMNMFSQSLPCTSNINPLPSIPSISHIFIP